MLKFKLKELLSSLGIRRQTFRKMNMKYGSFRKVSYGTYEISEDSFLNIKNYYATKQVRSWTCRGIVQNKK
jgi:hypothetical protein